MLFSIGGAVSFHFNSNVTNVATTTMQFVTVGWYTVQTNMHSAFRWSEMSLLHSHAMKNTGNSLQSLYFPHKCQCWISDVTWLAWVLDLLPIVATTTALQIWALQDKKYPITFTIYPVWSNTSGSYLPMEGLLLFPCWPHTALRVCSLINHLLTEDLGIVLEKQRRFQFCKCNQNSYINEESEPQFCW